MKKRILIGIITAQAADSEQRQLLSGIISKAQELDMDTAVFSNIYNSAEYHAEVEIENRIYDLIMSRQLDGLILTAESILNPTLQQEIFQRILARTDIPLVVTGAELEGCECINTDVQADTQNIVNHLIEVHGFTEIDFITGSIEAKTSHLRAEGYRMALRSHGLPFSEDRVIWGDYWITSGEELARQYISGERDMPQAVACANDYMAYGLCDCLMENGVLIPDDITVTGYEYVGGRYYHTPILTTYKRSRSALGARAAAILYSRITGKDVPLPPLTGHVICGDSCKCGADRQILCSELSAVRREQHYSRMNLVGNFEQQLTTCRSVSDYVGVLKEFAYLIRDVSGVYLCLFDSWCSSAVTGVRLSDPMICYTVVCPSYTDQRPVFFRADEEYPPVIESPDSSAVLYFCPIFFSGKYFGFFILQYPGADGYDIIFRDWLKIASNALELLRMKNDISTLLECRSLSVRHDSVTGLLNSEGLENELKLLLGRSSAERIGFILIRTDIFSDDMSIDSHRSGVELDCTVADILRSQSSGSDLCGRIAGKSWLFIRAEDRRSGDMELTADILLTLITYSPSYLRSCQHDSLIAVSREFSSGELTYSSALGELSAAADEELYRRTFICRSPCYPGYSSVREKIYSTPAKEHSSSAMCRSLAHSEGYFRSMYKKLFGISFHQDLIRSRVSYAKSLILTSQLSLASIAESCGYQDEKHFYHQFRKLTGVSPGQYRLSAQSSSERKDKP